MVGLDDRDEFTKGGFTLEEVNRMLDRMEILKPDYETDPRGKAFRKVKETLQRLKADLEAAQ